MKLDERRGKPSASSVYRYAACPGSYRMAINSKEFRSQELTEWADSGIRSLEAYHIESAENLNPNQNS